MRRRRLLLLLGVVVVSGWRSLNTLSCQQEEQSLSIVLGDMKDEENFPGSFKVILAFKGWEDFQGESFPLKGLKDDQRKLLGFETNQTSFRDSFTSNKVLISPSSSTSLATLTLLKRNYFPKLIAWTTSLFIFLFCFFAQRVFMRT